jgi:antitoxin VapB
MVEVMSLNIKNEETHRLAKELARRTGETITGAITQALRERLERVRRKQQTGLAGELLRIGKECASHMNEPFRSVDHGELLYDEKGLPR